MGKLFVALLFLYAPVVTQAAPARILIIRHAEKPATGPHLNERGRRRAAALVDFFRTNPRVTKYGPPAAIYAMAPSHDGGSVRAIETTAPLAKKLGVTLDTEFTKHELADLARAIYRRRELEGRTVLICWEHKVIPDMVEELGYQDGPHKWKGETYDRVWSLELRDGEVRSFEDIPQHLLSGDSPR